MENNLVLCQSCGMPLDQDPNQGGTNANGSKSDKYCSYCFQKGKFVDEGITLKDYTEKMVQISVSHLNIPENQAREMAESVLPNLERWKS
jgi:hypothetical protein